MEVIKFLKSSKIEGEEIKDMYSKPNKRDVYEKLKKGRLNVLYGIRGSGKTTLLFQRYSDYKKDKRIYLNGEEMELLGISLLEVFKNLRYVVNKNAGIFLDEINSIKGWDKELKVIYDKFPYYNIYVSGSSSASLLESKRILARRALYHSINQLTFREYLRIKKGKELKKFNLNAKDLLGEAIKYDIYINEMLKGKAIEAVNEFIEKNLPFLFEAEKTMLMDLMDKIIYEDILKAYSFEKEVIEKFHRLIFLIAMSEKTSYENLSRDLGISKAVVGEMIRALVNSGIIKAILPYGTGRVVGRKSWRYMFPIPAIRKLYMEKGNAEKSRIIGLLREDIVVSNMKNVFYMKGGVDFYYEGFYIEVGGKYKRGEQFKGIKGKKIIVYDGEEVEKDGDVLKIPLYIFLSYF